jgi:large subunit ribosomal protein L5
VLLLQSLFKTDGQKSSKNIQAMSTTTYKPRLGVRYTAEIVPALMKKFNYSSVMQVPRLQKICLNQGVNGATSDKKLVDIAVQEMTTIAGQKAVSAKSRIAISNFKLRENMPIASRVTLRGDRMFEFLDRFVSISLPRVRDFKGVNNKGFDGRGNYNMGIKEQIIFPELDIDKINKITGMDVTFVTTAKTDAEALALLELLGMPFKK